MGPPVNTFHISSWNMHAPYPPKCLWELVLMEPKQTHTQTHIKTRNSQASRPVFWNKLISQLWAARTNTIAFWFDCLGFWEEYFHKFAQWSCKCSALGMGWDFNLLRLATKSQWECIRILALWTLQAITIQTNLHSSRGFMSRRSFQLFSRLRTIWGSYLPCLSTPPTRTLTLAIRCFCGWGEIVNRLFLIRRPHAEVSKTCLLAKWIANKNLLLLDLETMHMVLRV